VNWITAQELGSLKISVVTLGEFEKGFALTQDLHKRLRLETWLELRLNDLFRGQALNIDPAIAKRWGNLMARRQMAGRPLAAADGMIAATALQHDLTLVTRNEKDFEGLGLSILNPWNPAVI
jgi:toxin FitB